LDHNPGGQIFVNYDAANVNISYNLVDGESVSCPSPNNFMLPGLELYGPNVQITRNTITNQSYEGITIGGPFGLPTLPSATITYNTISNNYSDGIAIGLPWYTACSGNPPSFVISNNTFTNNATSTVDMFFQVDYQMPQACGWPTSSDPPFIGPLPLSENNTFSGAGGRIYGDYYGGPTWLVPTLYPIQ
jgi:hypothetical protein